MDLTRYIREIWAAPAALPTKIKPDSTDPDPARLAPAEVIAQTQPWQFPRYLHMRDGIHIHIFQSQRDLFEAHIVRHQYLLSLLAGRTAKEAEEKALIAWRLGWD